MIISTINTLESSLSMIRQPFVFFFLIALVFISHSPQLNAADARFKSINVNDGLPGNMVRIITQDEQGYMWFGTNLGLARYDGYTLKTYKDEANNPNSIGGSFIRALEVDSNNVLWASGGLGLSRYNRNTDDFTVFSANKSSAGSLISNYITSIKKAKPGFLWVATAEGLELFDIKRQEFEHHQYSSKNTASLPSNNVRTLMKTRNRDLWIGTTEGLAQYNHDTGAFKRIRLTNGVQPQIFSISESQSGNIWVSSMDGLFQIDRETLAVEKIQISDNPKWIVGTLVDNDDSLWFSMLDSGLFRLAKDGQIQNFLPDKGDAYSLAGPSVMSSYKDRSGIIWLGTFRSGISYFNPSSLAFGSFKSSNQGLDCLDTLQFSSALALDKSVLLLGTYTSGLFEVDLAQKTCKNFRYIANGKTTISNNNIRAIYKDSSGNIWIASENSLDRFKREEGKFDNVVSQNKGISILLVLEISNHLVLAGDGILHKINLTTGELSEIAAADKILNSTTYYSLDVDDKGNIYGATQNGVVIINKGLSEVSLLKVKNQPLLQQRITALVVDKQNYIWLAIDSNGLFKFYLDSKELENVNEKFGIPNKEGMSGLYLGYDDDLWLTTQGSGLFKIEEKLEKATNYRMADGLNSEEIREAAFAYIPGRKLFFGTSTGFNIFDPQEIQINKTPPIVSLTQLSRFGEAVIPGETYDGFGINEHISRLDNLTLSHRDSVFGFEFVAINYLEPNKIIYSYRLKGFQDKWTTTNSLNRGVNYNNLDPGNYHFQLKAKTSKGIWSEENVSLKVTILPAPWLTWWAYSLYFIVFVLSIYYFIKKRTQILEQRAHDLKNAVKKRTEELFIEKDKVEQLLRSKQEEFANISHEFRTPLALILGPAEQMASASLSGEMLKKVDVIKRNAFRLLRMVDQLLQLETFRVKTITQKSVQDFHTITLLIAESFNDLAERRGIDFKIGNIAVVYSEFTPDALEKILLNLLSNAIKYTDKGGVISISVARDATQQLIISVKDTGIGIPQDKLASIFDRFSRVLNEHSERVTGAGIGLALVKEIVEAHNGQITVESILGKGTNITVHLPIIGEVKSIDKAYYANAETLDSELMELVAPTVDVISEVDTEHEQRNCPSILVIEDNPDMQSYIVECLTPTFHCITANNGELGLALAKEKIPDLVISDVMMPKMDGYQVTKSLREELTTSHIPVIMLTALGDRESRLKGWQERADEYLTKPFDVEELNLRVKSILDIRELVRKRLTDSLFQPPQSLARVDGAFEDDNKSQKCQKEVLFLEKLNQELEVLYQDSELKIDSIATVLCMSQRQLFRKLKGILDITPTEYLKYYRLDKAREFLMGGLSAGRVAYDVGFATHSHFSKIFKARYGCAPSEYKNKLEAEIDS